MLKKIYTTLLVAVAAGTVALAQVGTLKGTVTDGKSGEALSFANVQVEAGGGAVAKTIADIDGNFTIKAIQPGTYDLKVVAVGYKTIMVKGIVVGADKTTYQNDLKAETTAEIKDEVVITEYVVPLVDPDTKSGGNITRDQFVAMPSKNINSVASTTAGVFQSDEGSGLSVRGGRQNTDGPDGGSTKYIIDGVPVGGSAGVPQSAIEQVSVITGGVPAQYGDATGGFVNITTRGGIRPEYYGGVEFVSSQLTDDYGYNYGNFSVGGPLMSKKDSAGNKTAKVGFFVSGELTSDKDPSPSSVGVYKVKDAKLAELEAHPLSLADNGSGLTLNSNFVTKDDMEHLNARQNVGSNSAKLDAKIDFQMTKDIKLTVGGSYDYNNYRDFTFAYSLFNSRNNAQYIKNTARVYGKITHKLGKAHAQGEKSTSIIQNAYYTLLVSYNRSTDVLQSADHKDNYFDYGYIGHFQTFKAPTYAAVRDSATGPVKYYTQVGWADTAVNFTAGDLNPLGANYTKDYYDLMGTPSTLTDIAPWGLRNGDRPSSPYSLFNNTGRQVNGYHNRVATQFRITGTFSADIKNHNLQLGVDYEQRSSAAWDVSPTGLWSLGRLLVNKHLTSLSSTDSTLDHTTNSVNYYTHPYTNDAATLAQESTFGKSVRGAVGVADNKWVDLDNLDPSQLSISMFSPDELLNNGNSYVTSYYGYSYDNQKLNGTSFDMKALESFYKDKDAVGNYTRVTPAFQPIYYSGYIQDKFDVKDMKFNIGLRMDGFNANQPVLQDKYLLYETYKVSEDTKFTHPSNMASNYVVYVDDAKNPTKIVGYRDGDNWYNKDGIQVADPKVIAQATNSGSIQPYLKYPHENFLDSSKVSNVFKMYETQINFMPRIAFSFPISKEANFFAHYDVLTQRPPSSTRIDPTNYLFIQSGYFAAVSNPALKPEKTIDYELGFTQVLNERKNAALTITAFYRQMKDMLQQRSITDAYPVTYTTYDNVDFGNVKGLSVAYDLRRTGNSSLNASYTLQFAEGTGSTSTSASSVIASGQPNLKSTNPLDFDQRHSFVLSYDYRFGSGKDYNGPQAKWAKAIFENFGGNIVGRAGSGLPYSRIRNVVSGNGNGDTQVIMGLNQSSTLDGNVNGSNLPWQYRIDLRLDKHFPLTWGKGTGDKAKKSNLTVFLQVLNLFDTQNILNIYRHTGDPKDDGYLSDPSTQGFISGQPSPQAFRDQYDAKLGVPTNYSIPRRMRIGITLDF